MTVCLLKLTDLDSLFFHSPTEVIYSIFYPPFELADVPHRNHSNCSTVNLCTSVLFPTYLPNSYVIMINIYDRAKEVKWSWWSQRAGKHLIFCSNIIKCKELEKKTRNKCNTRLLTISSFCFLHLHACIVNFEQVLRWNF